MKQDRCKRSEVWIALQSTIWRALSYPLQAINLSKKQWETIMAILLNYALPAMGICRNFPRVIVFAPKQSLGLGLQHQHMIQETTRPVILYIANLKVPL
jgi:hypothetical protein